MRRVVLILAAIALAVVGLFVWTVQGAKMRNSAAAMPLAQEAPSPATFSVKSATQFKVRQLQEFEYTPSAKIRKVVLESKTWDGIVPITWHYSAPQIGRPVPLVILFHGRDRTGLSMMDMWYETARNNGFAILAPTAPNGLWPIEAPSPQALDKMIDQLSKSHKIDLERVYLFGHSAGAVYAQALLNKAQGPWKAAALHGGFLPASHQIVATDPKPYRAYMGHHETAFATEDIQATGEEMALRGVANELIIIPQHTHWFYDIGPQIAEDAWEWFQNQS